MRRLDPEFDFGQPMEAAVRFAEQHQVTLVLKGQRSIIAFPDGRTYVNPTGSPALAKGGSGDVLTGMIAALLAQHPVSPDQAVLAAVWLHGRAGEHAERVLGERSVLATDTTLHFGKALADAQRDLHNG
jgi:NAD(P)H-hydrate epimerase